MISNWNTVRARVDLTSGGFILFETFPTSLVPTLAKGLDLKEERGEVADSAPHSHRRRRLKEVTALSGFWLVNHFIPFLISFVFGAT